MKYTEIEGNLITLATEGVFEVVAHGVNCFCTMGAGLAPQMVKAFKCDKFPLEDKKYKGDINKLGQIDFTSLHFSNWDKVFYKYPDEGDKILFGIYVVNAYTQFNYDAKTKPFDYDAFILCMRKINYVFEGKKIGLPQIGAGLAGGDWNRISNIIKSELTKCEVTVVIFKPN